MDELISFMPSNDEDYEDHPAFEIFTDGNVFAVDTVTVDGDTTSSIVCTELYIALLQVAALLARTPEIKYTIQQ